jgi:hypothetical protein
VVECRVFDWLTIEVRHECVGGWSGPIFLAFSSRICARELRNAGVRISLPEQTLHVLEGLLDRPGDLVSREQLRQRVWPAETFVDFEHGLNAAVRRLRDASATRRIRRGSWRSCLDVATGSLPR